MVGLHHPTKAQRGAIDRIEAEEASEGRRGARSRRVEDGEPEVGREKLRLVEREGLGIQLARLGPID
jgi:hypothetical protein